MTNKSHRTSRKRAAATPKQSFPRWYASDKNQAIAEWLAHNFYLDRLLGREPSPDVEPYSNYQHETVVAFLAKLQSSDGTRHITSTKLSA